MSKQHQNGSAAEDIAAAYERLRLGKQAAKKIRYVSDRHGLGFDIQSSESSSSDLPRFIEVKSSTEGGCIFLTERERINLKALGKAAWLYVVDLSCRRVIKTIQNPMNCLEFDGRALAYKIKL